MLRLSKWGLIALIAVGATPVFAQSANFGTLSLAPGFPGGTGQAAGKTAGAFSLSAIANRDRNSNACFGFGAETPDHILVLKSDFPKLSVQVDSDGKDTTLVIKGPNDTTLCGDDTGSSKDASVSATNWQAGEYKVWVGAIDAGQAWNYTLSVRE